jgi:hypothetical protein
VVLGICCVLGAEARAQAEHEIIEPQPLTIDATVEGGYLGDVVYDAGAYSCRPWEYGTPDLFYNFYVPNNCGGAPAQMYLAPRPVPQLVGHTYYTYQPLMPHEFLYPHYRTYRRWYNEGRGMTRTRAVWHYGPSAVFQGACQALRIPR